MEIFITSVEELKSKISNKEIDQSTKILSFNLPTDRGDWYYSYFEKSTDLIVVTNKEAKEREKVPADSIYAIISDEKSDSSVQGESSNEQKDVILPPSVLTIDAVSEQKTTSEEKHRVQNSSKSKANVSRYAAEVTEKEEFLVIEDKTLNYLRHYVKEKRQWQEVKRVISLLQNIDESNKFEVLAESILTLNKELSNLIQ